MAARRLCIALALLLLFVSMEIKTILAPGSGNCNGNQGNNNGNGNGNGNEGNGNEIATEAITMGESLYAMALVLYVTIHLLLEVSCSTSTEQKDMISPLNKTKTFISMHASSVLGGQGGHETSHGFKPSQSCLTLTLLSLQPRESHIGMTI
ncbi:unnamed protein product [Fraxinus pennsylvanica]|uniref:Uncharacterized protein n=1 Tax=Fraxinus pennsylvanica TaxID=56036 RepID=A0AAD1Z384_9LAMI|nr:unnamed protein product [Fraxinus pennsylvanica]